MPDNSIARDAVRISVVMTTYQGARFVRQQIETILAQTRPADEIIVCDDASTDGTVEIVEAAARRSSVPVQVRRNASRLGLRLNLQGAFGRATGTVIVLADQDDLWAPDKLQAVALAFEDPAVTLWFSDAELIDEKSEPVGRRAWQTVNFSEPDQELVRNGSGLARLLYGQVVTGATMAVRADVVRLALPLPRELDSPGHLFLHDGWLAVLARLLGSIVVDSRPLTLYRQHAAQVTGMSMSLPSGSEDVRHSDRTAQLVAEHARVTLVTDRIRRSDQPSTMVGTLADELLRRKILLDVRTMPRETRGRALKVFEQVREGAYAQFSSGVRAALRDLVDPAVSRKNSQ